MVKEMAEEKRKNYWCIDLLGAIACGYLIGAFQQHTADSGQDIPGNFVRCVLLAIGSYSAMALLLPILNLRPLRRVPNWILIVVLGSAIFYICVHLVDTVTYAWEFRYTQPELSSPGYILSYVWSSVLVYSSSRLLIVFWRCRLWQQSIILAQR